MQPTVRAPRVKHITQPTEDALAEEVKRLEKQRDHGTAQQPGKLWTVEKWLWHWVENIAKDVVSENTYDGYEVAVCVHLVPGIGKHRIDRLEPEHLESLYRRMQKNGSKAATAHQAHRTARTALGEAVRRGHAAKNAAALAKPPRVEEPEEEIEPLLGRGGAEPAYRGEQATQQRPLDAGLGPRPATGGDAGAACVGPM